MNETYSALISTYSTQLDRLKALLEKCPRSMWEFKPAPEHWSIREVLHHLADAELNFTLRIRFGVAEPGSPVHSFEQEVWGRGLLYAQRYPETAIDLYESLVRDNHGLFLELSDEDFAKTVQHSTRGPLTVEYLIGFCDVHLKKHLDQIQRRLSEWKAQGGQG